MHRFRIAVALALVLSACAPPVTRQFTATGSGRISATHTIAHKPDAPVLVRGKKGRYRVTKPWSVELDGRIWHVQKGYASNGITAPDKVKQSLGDGVDHPETWAAVFHDWLFTQPGITRAQADTLFYHLLLAYGVPQTKSRLMYSAVSAYSATKTAG